MKYLYTAIVLATLLLLICCVRVHFGRNWIGVKCANIEAIATRYKWSLSVWRIAPINRKHPESVSANLLWEGRLLD